MTDPLDLPPAISCPRGTYAVYNDGQVVTIALIDVFNQDTAVGIVDSVNRILETDRSQNWKYCIYVGHNTLSALDAEQKFVQFIQFRKWLSGVMDHQCKVALIFENGGNAVTKNQVQRIFCEADVAFKRFESKDKAIEWLKSNREYLE